MREQRVPTLADAQREVWVRGVIGGLLIGLTLIFLLLVLMKHFYLDLPHDLFFSKQGKDLRTFIDSLLHSRVILDRLWRAIPPRQPTPVLPTAPLWEYVYVLWGVLVVMAVGGLLLRSARARRAQITEFHQEMQREAWRQQARATGGVAPACRGQTTVIGQAIWHDNPAPPESWSQSPRGIVILGLIVALVSGLLRLYADYSFFQAYWPSSRN